ncbi:hypothetical protein WA026_019820 [Henosepilachna vigintioctopunctata]|uniref:Uncharacterized protein n=1 Tax=Henosepilachna vigintioctopunctata TaxID=420089 RepID=A0AAW1VIP1_9CUCU
MLVKFIMFSMLMLFTKVHTNESSEEEEGIVQECAKKSGVTIDELKHFRTDNVSAPMLCFMKCKYEKQGYVDEKGQLIKEVIQDRYDDLNLNEEERKKVDKCIDESKLVKKCTDLKDFFKCVPVIDFSE